jgi:ERCC4-type nuclease
MAIYMTRRIVIDYREKSLIEKCQNRIEFSVENLPVADIALFEDSVPRILIERKTLSDLSQSIKDTRFREQKVRLLDFSKQATPSAKIAYWVEGKVSNMPVKTLYSAILNCQYRDQLCVYRLKDISETADLLVSLGQKFLAVKEPFTDFSNSDKPTTHKIEIPVAKKRGTFSREEGFQRILCQIPSISTNKALALSLHFETPEKMFQSLQQIEGDTSELKSQARRNLLSSVRLSNGTKLGPASAQKILYFLGFTEFVKIPVEPKKKSLHNT